MTGSDAPQDDRPQDRALDRFMATLGHENRALLGWTALGAILTFAALAAIVATCSRLENVRKSYSSYADAERDGLVERGWMPPFVPRSAVRIDAWHKLDSNCQEMSFGAPREDLLRMVSKLESLSLGRGSDREALETARRRWLSTSERLAGAGSSGRIDGYRASGTYEYGDYFFFVAINWRENEVFLWSC